MTTVRTKATRLLGEPVAIVGAVQAALVMAVSFHWLDALGLHSQSDVALVVVVVSAGGAVYTAVVTKHTVLAPVIALFQALVNLGVIYGLTISTEQTGLVVAFITAVFALFHRTQTSPTPATTKTTVKKTQAGQASVDYLLGLALALFAGMFAMIVLVAMLHP